MNIHEKIENVEEAQDKIREAIVSLEDAFKNDDYVRRTLINGLKVLAGNDHEILDKSFNCDELLESLNNNLENGED